MNPALLAVIWVLVSLDCALMGYRLAMGRSALLDKRRYFQLASLRGALFAQGPLLAVTVLAVVLVERGGPGLADEFDEAMARFAAAGGAYAAVILVASLVCLFPSVTVRAAASVTIFGPLTLLRPLVVIATVLVAVGTNPAPEVLAVGLCAVVPGVLWEPLMDRRIARHELI